MAKHISVQHTAGPMNNRRRIKDADPNFHYHYANVRDKNRVEDLAEAMDYEVVNKADHKVKVDGDNSLDGAVTAGGDVLMRCPMPVWEERQKLLRERTKEFTRGPAEAFKTEGNKNDVKTFDNSKRTVGPMSSVLGGK